MGEAGEYCWFAFSIAIIAIYAMEPVYQEVYLVLVETILSARLPSSLAPSENVANGSEGMVSAWLIEEGAIWPRCSLSLACLDLFVCHMFVIGFQYLSPLAKPVTRIAIEMQGSNRKQDVYTLLHEYGCQTSNFSRDSSHLLSFLLRVEEDASRVFVLRTFEDSEFIQTGDAFFLSLAPLMKVLRSPTGSWKGKSRAASMMAKKIHQPHMSVTKVSAPAAVRHLVAVAAWAASPVKQPKARTKVKKIIAKTTLVRREQMK
ncbi:hypothetical protein KCU83_g2, partial [Aureobasidium melanogenum]